MDLSEGRSGPAVARHPVLTLGVAAAGATALWVRQRARRAEREHPAVGRFVEVDGVRLHYLERGSGPAVVLLHGNMVPLQDFLGSGLFELLSRRHRVIAFDRPGFGYSERPRDRVWTLEAQAELLHRAMARLGIERPVVLGHSMGTLVALRMALANPGELRGLVLASGYYEPTLRLDVPLAAPSGIPLIGDVLRYTVSPLFTRLLLKPMAKAMFWPRPVPDDFFVSVPREMLLRPSQLRAVSQDAAFMIPAAARSRHHYQELKLPVTILAGEQDRIVDPSAHAACLHQALPHSDLLVLPGLGHMLHYAVPEKVAETVGRISGVAPLEQMAKVLSEPDAPAAGAQEGAPQHAGPAVEPSAASKWH